MQLNHLLPPIAGGAQQQGARRGGSGTEGDEQALGALQASSKYLVSFLLFLLEFLCCWVFFVILGAFCAFFWSGIGGQEGAERWER